MQLVIAIVVNALIFFLLKPTLGYTLLIIAACAGAWYSNRLMFLKDPELRSNPFTMLFMLWGSTGVVLGGASLLRFI